MADTANAPAAADAAKPLEEQTRLADTPTESVAAEAKPAEGGEVATEAAATEDTKPESTEQKAADAPTDANTDKAAEGEEAPAAESTATNGTPAQKKAGNKPPRKSGAGVPEHKKKTPAKKKAAPELRLNVQPGEMWFVAMRGYPPWPVIVCDEEMLPESLLSKRPVSARRIDGTYREDFMDGGKNAKDRRYPVMFLGTNEFAWQVNTELQPFDLESVKKEVESGNNQKKSKALWAAYEVAALGHDLAHFKEMLANHEQAMQEKPEPKSAKKSAKRKSTAGDEDVEMEDAGDDAAPTKKKATKKRKKTEETEADQPEKPAKTPKTKLKLNNKAPKDESTTKPKETKAKKGKAKSASVEAEPPKPEEPPMTEEERIQKREKSVLYLRHRLQKGFLSRDQAPKDEDMSNMSDYLKQLEEHVDLEAEVIKKTKVHKVLKAIIKLNSIPKEDEFQFKKRSTDLLTQWSGALAAESEPSGDAPASASAEPTTNGVNHDEKGEIKSEEKSAVPEKTDADGDVSMAEAKDESPAVQAEATSNTETTEAAA